MNIFSHQSEAATPFGRGFFCPQCGARYCSLPIECRVCRLTLISAPQLARSFQHLMPLPAFEEVDITSEWVIDFAYIIIFAKRWFLSNIWWNIHWNFYRTCFACAKTVEVKGFSCKECHATFCIDCDLILHDSLQICPSCCWNMFWKYLYCTYNVFYLLFFSFNFHYWINFLCNE